MYIQHACPSCRHIRAFAEQRWPRGGFRRSRCQYSLLEPGETRLHTNDNQPSHHAWRRCVCRCLESGRPSRCKRGRRWCREGFRAITTKKKKFSREGAGDGHLSLATYLTSTDRQLALDINSLLALNITACSRLNCLLQTSLSKWLSHFGKPSTSFRLLATRQPHHNDLRFSTPPNTVTKFKRIFSG